MKRADIEVDSPELPGHVIHVPAVITIASRCILVYTSMLCRKMNREGMF